jgi:hypothetical protein
VLTPRCVKYRLQRILSFISFSHPLRREASQTRRIVSSKPPGNTFIASRFTLLCDDRVNVSRRQPADPAGLAMSHPDNLYSAEESDHESFSDELSPADGYFNRGDMASSAMVPDPTLEDSKEPEAKTLIPPQFLESMRGSRSSNPSSSLPSRSYASAHSASNSVPSGSSYTPTSPVASRRLDDLFPRRPASINGPPPAYTPSPEPIFSPAREPVQTFQPSHRSQPSQTRPSVTHPRPSSQPTPPSQPNPPSPPDQSSPVTYNTFPEQHLERGYLPRRDEPESMGSPAQIPSESTPLSRTSRSRRQSPCRNILRRLLLVALVFTITTTLLTAVFGGQKSVSLIRLL